MSDLTKFKALCEQATKREDKRVNNPLSEEELTDFENYAKAHETGYGADSKFARIALRLIAEVREHRTGAAACKEQP